MLTNHDADRVDFDEGLLLEDSWERELEEDEYEVERIAYVRSSKKTRYDRIRLEYLVFWRATTSCHGSTRLISTVEHCYETSTGDGQSKTGLRRCSRMKSERWNICGGLVTVDK
ncbi:hypothetical protein F441_08308 [Phytophthora nicotianae CJ01A1]|uniref:Chromo domain-containing protein n=1 Tax=Phytophthora nicotianae CJ01A1 TaxID=1317063 RepID=W2X459_PHYNI|nr:hypothetical protein F441_08308 [Phytophthora nicotianae CJ01A1]